MNVPDMDPAEAIERLIEENAELRRKLNKWDEDLRHLDAQVDEEKERAKRWEHENAVLREKLEKVGGEAHKALASLQGLPEASLYHLPMPVQKKLTTCWIALEGAVSHKQEGEESHE